MIISILIIKHLEIYSILLNLQKSHLKDLIGEFDLPVFLFCWILADVVNVPETYVV